MARQLLNGRQRAIGYGKARACELGEGVRCHCRCGGAFHGARRVNFDANPLGLGELPADDPHYVPIATIARQLVRAYVRSEGSADE